MHYPELLTLQINNLSKIILANKLPVKGFLGFVIIISSLPIVRVVVWFQGGPATRPLSSHGRVPCSTARK